MSYFLAILSSIFLISSNTGFSSLEAASKSKKEKSSKYKSKSKPLTKGTYTSKQIDSFWEEGALFGRATHVINGNFVQIHTVVDVAGFSPFKVGQQFIYINGVLTSTLTIWEYGTYNGNACMAHYYLDATVYSSVYDSVFIVK